MSLASKPGYLARRRRAIEQMQAHLLFHRMMRHQGIDPTAQWSRDLEGMVFRALAACKQCTHTEACRRWLEADHPLASYAVFCPNAEIIETCRILDPDAPPLKAGSQGTATSREPTLAEVMADPIVRLVAASDDPPGRAPDEGARGG